MAVIVAIITFIVTLAAGLLFVDGIGYEIQQGDLGDELRE